MNEGAHKISARYSVLKTSVRAASGQRVVSERSSRREECERTGRVRSVVDNVGVWVGASDKDRSVREERRRRMVHPLNRRLGKVGLEATASRRRVVVDRRTHDGVLSVGLVDRPAARRFSERRRGGRRGTHVSQP